VWAVGDNGIGDWHWDGHAWSYLGTISSTVTTLPGSGTVNSFGGIWGTTGAVWAVGSEGTILRHAD
jgi:hypothetical protein